MDYSDIIQLATNVGFPIIAYILLFKQYNEVLTGVQKSIQDNTLMIQKLIDKFDSQK